ncbi:DoxX family protein [Streptomyces sp. NPDC048507]|uniref:DoxX family protein n=1 Tax=Streptomyces sp. NPDC048507 TaxID=3365560 RepID=UPI003710ADF0
MPHRLPAGDTRLLGMFRIVTGFLFACHGLAKLFGVIGDGPAPTGQWPYWWAGVIELGGGTLVAAGLLTRPASLLCSGTMAYAYFTEHQPHGLLPLHNDGEAAALYCWTFLALAVITPTGLSLAGAGRRARAALHVPKAADPRGPGL